MIQTWLTAGRNLLRNRRRSALTLLSMIAASSAIIVFAGYIDFSLDALRESTIRTELGHFQIGRPGFAEHEGQADADQLIDAPADLATRLARIAHITAITPRLSASGLISSGARTLPARLIGIDPNSESAWSSGLEFVRGHGLGAADHDGCVLGRTLASGLQLAPGMVATILGTTLDGVINAVDCRVTGIVRTQSSDFDKVYVRMPLSVLQKLLDTHGVDKLLVRIGHTSDVPQMHAALRALVSPGYEVKSWIELADYYQSVAGIYRSIFGVTSIVLGLVIALGVANTMSMSVMERISELGTLRALGQTRCGLLGLLLAEGALLGLAGGWLGCAVGLALACVINLSGGIAIPPPPGMSHGYTAFIAVNIQSAVLAMTLCLGCALLSSLYPAWLAARLDPIDALVHR